jgi:2-amino-4-hydroxy-6-hydroxymethyldihydropteridine diphosphokinase
LRAGAATFRAYLGLGANLGNPAAQLRAAIQALRDSGGVQLGAVSAFYRSEPIGPPGQPCYCNAACAIDTELNPPQLLAHLQTLELAAGRTREQWWGPRVLDLDILHVEGQSLRTPQLKLPHPQLARRNFVLIPLAEVAPGLDIPGLGRIDELARRAGRKGLEPWPEDG